MTRLKTIAIQLFPVYILLLLALAVFAESNQVKADRHVRLIRERTAVLEDLALQRTATATLTGPLAINSWASARGMTAAPNVTALVTVAPHPAPAKPGMLTNVMEVRTIWR